jgi:hypothetical protein
LKQDLKIDGIFDKLNFGAIALDKSSEVLYELSKDPGFEA